MEAGPSCIRVGGGKYYYHITIRHYVYCLFTFQVVQIATWLPYHQYQVMGRHVLQPGHQAPREEVEVSVPALIVFKYLSKCSLGRSPQKKHAPEVV